MTNNDFLDSLECDYDGNLSAMIMAMTLDEIEDLADAELIQLIDRAQVVLEQVYSKLGIDG